MTEILPAISWGALMVISKKWFYPWTVVSNKNLWNSTNHIFPKNGYLPQTLSQWLGVYGCNKHFQIHKVINSNIWLLIFPLFPLGVTTEEHLSPFHPVFCNFLCHTVWLYVLFYHYSCSYSSITDDSRHSSLTSPSCLHSFLCLCSTLQHCSEQLSPCILPPAPSSSLLHSSCFTFISICATVLHSSVIAYIFASPFFSSTCFFFSCLGKLSTLHVWTEADGISHNESKSVSISADLPDPYTNLSVSLVSFQSSQSPN